MTETKNILEIMEAVNNISDGQHNLKVYFEKYIQNMDAWVKEINNKVGSLMDIKEITNENTDNTQHNYELIYEIKDQMEEMKQELTALKLIQIISLKKAKEEGIPKEREKILKGFDNQRGQGNEDKSQGFMG